MSPMIWSPLAGGRIFDDKTTDERTIRVRAAMKKVGKQLDASLDQVQPW